MLYFVMYVNIYIIYIYHENDNDNDYQLINIIHPYNYSCTLHSYTKFILLTFNLSSHHFYEYLRIYHLLILFLCCNVINAWSIAIFIGNFLYCHLLGILIILISIYLIDWIIIIGLILYVHVLFSYLRFGFIFWMGIYLLLVGKTKSHLATTHRPSSHICVQDRQSLALRW